jgi:hypothetical protein
MNAARQPVFAVVGGPRSGCSIISRLLAKALGGVVDTALLLSMQQHPAFRGRNWNDREVYWQCLDLVMGQSAHCTLVADNPIRFEGEAERLQQLAWQCGRPSVRIIWLNYEMSYAYDRMEGDDQRAFFQAWQDFEQFVIPQLWPLMENGTATRVEARLLTPEQIVADVLQSLGGVSGNGPEPSGS